MVKSMTGYGRAVETVNGREFTVEVRSVNNRYLDCTVKLPRAVSFGEDAVKQAVKARISRGKVDVFVSLRSEGTSDVTVTLNTPMVEGYLAAVKQMCESYGLPNDVTAATLTGLPDVFCLDKPQVDEEQLQKDLLAGGYAETTPAAVVYKATWRDQKIFRCTVGTLHKTVTQNGLTKTSLIVVGGCLGGEYMRSLLYHPGFSTEFREASE